MSRYFILISILLLQSFNAESHPVHVSVCNIEIKGDTLTLAMKFFQDDFQLAIEHNFGKVIDLGKADHSPARGMIENYLTTMFTISLNKKDTLRLNYLKSEINEDAIWFYYNCEVRQLKKLIIHNALLLDIYDDQTNLVIVSFNGKQNGYRFNLKNLGEDIDLKK